MPPYATVIIPTHDRAATLDVTVESVQRQSVHDIQILIAGDGATNEVVEIAKGLTAKDSRVQFIPFDKAPGSGGANRHRAISEFARSERIFYTDDDDLWLAQHVEMIGLHLDHFDIVDTLPVSATACGRLALTCVNSGSMVTRSLLAGDKLQSMYDTHLAHRRSTYLALGAPWTRALGGDVVFKVLGTFAAADVRWKTLPLATAVSLHGGARSTASAAERRAEIQAWRQRLQHHDALNLTQEAHPAWPLFYCLNLFGAQPNETVHDYLGRLGMALPCNSCRQPEDDALVLPLDAARSREVETAFALHQGTPVDLEQLTLVAPLLLDIVKVAVASWPFLRRALRHLPIAKAMALVRSLPRTDPCAVELLEMFEAYLLLWARQPHKALPIAERILASVRLVPQEAELLLGEIHLALENLPEGIAYLSRAADRENRGSSISSRLAVALMKTGQLDAARRCIERIESRLSGLPHTVALRRRLAELEEMRGGAL